MRQWDIYGQRGDLAQMQLICHLPWDDIWLPIIPPSAKNSCHPHTVVGVWMWKQEKSRMGAQSTLGCGAGIRNL